MNSRVFFCSHVVSYLGINLQQRLDLLERIFCCAADRTSPALRNILELRARGNAAISITKL